MMAPIHRWKKHVNYDKCFHWIFEGSPCWLGSGIVDKNGVEIYEGDRVQIGGNENDTFPVIFDDAAFWLGCNEYFLYHFESSEIEVVGHITEDKS